VTPGQAFELEQRVKRLGVSDGELLAMAREVAEESALQSLADLTRQQTSDLIVALDRFEHEEAGRQFRRRELAEIG